MQHFLRPTLCQARDSAGGAKMNERLCLLFKRSQACEASGVKEGGGWALMQNETKKPQL